MHSPHPPKEKENNSYVRACLYFFFIFSFSLSLSLFLILTEIRISLLYIRCIYVYCTDYPFFRDRRNFLSVSFSLSQFPPFLSLSHPHKNWNFFIIQKRKNNFFQRYQEFSFFLSLSLSLSLNYLSYPFSLFLILIKIGISSLYRKEKIKFFLTSCCDVYLSMFEFLCYVYIQKLAKFYVPSGI